MNLELGVHGVGTLKQAPQRTPLAALTGIRAIAALWVVCLHYQYQITALFPFTGPAAPVLSAGGLGVDLFFALSGFILSYNYLEEFSLEWNWPAYLRFLRKRLARIYPVHIFALLVMSGLIAVRIWQGHKFADPAMFTVRGWIENVLLIHDWPGIFSGPTWNFPSWSISAEWLAYLAFPAVAIVIGRLRSVPLVTALIACSYAPLVVMACTGHDYVLPGYGPLRIACGFTAGCLLHRFYRREKLAGLPWHWIVPGSVIVVVLLCAVLRAYPGRVGIVVPLFGVIVLGLSLGGGMMNRLLATRTMVFLGEASYALYMTHAVSEFVLIRVIAVDRWVNTPLAYRIAIASVYVTVTIGTAVAVYLYVEKPMRRLFAGVSGEGRNCPIATPLKNLSQST